MEKDIPSKSEDLRDIPLLIPPGYSRHGLESASKSTYVQHDELIQPPRNPKTQFLRQNYCGETAILSGAWDNDQNCDHVDQEMHFHSTLLDPNFVKNVEIKTDGKAGAKISSNSTIGDRFDRSSKFSDDVADEKGDHYFGTGHKS